MWNSIVSVPDHCLFLLFYFYEIIVLISFEGAPTQIRMGVGSITFHARGAGGGGS